jgi:hypothetical protein
MGIRSDLKMYETAINNDYPISPEMRQRMMEVSLSIMEDSASSARERLSAVKVILAADKHNNDRKKHDRTVTLLGIANRLGIGSEVEGAYEN